VAKIVIKIPETAEQTKAKELKTKVDALKAKSNPSLTDVYDATMLNNDLLVEVNAKLDKLLLR